MSYGKYEFVDPGETAGADDILPAEAMLIDGQALEQAISGFRTLNVSGRELLGQTLTTLPIGNSDGVFLQNVTQPARTLTVKYMINARSPDEFRQAFYGLNRILSGKEHRVIFHDDPDKYYIATLQDAGSVPEGKNSIISSFTLLIPNGIAHDNEMTTVTPDANNQLLVNNQGTATAYPIITATMKSDNGLVAFANDKGGYLQFGNSEEVDKVVPKSQSLSKNNMALTTGTTNMASVKPLPTLMGQLSKTGGFTSNGKIFTVSSYGADTNSWAGPSWSYKFPTDSYGSIGQKNFSFIFRTYFLNSAVNQAGIQMFTVNREDGSILASIVIHDGSLGSSNATIDFFVGEQRMKTVNFKNAKDGYAGLMAIKKSGSRFDFTYGQGVISSFSDYSLTDTEGYYVTYGVGKWKGATAVKRMELEYWSLGANYTDAIEDIPNRFEAGDVVTVDIADRKIYVNNVLDNTLQTVGNQWESFALTPGQTAIQPVASSWATMYDCQLTYREAWI